MANYTSPADEAFFAAIGRFTVSWAQLELGLDCVVEIMYLGFNGKDIEPEMPRALKQKLKFLRIAIKKLSIPDDAAKGYFKLFDQITAAAVIRNDIIHGVITEHVEHSGEATMVHALRNKSGVFKKEFTMTTSELLKATNEAQRLGSKTLYWATEFYDLIAKLANQTS